MAKSKYYVKFKVESRYVIEVEAENLKEAKKEAEYQFSGADFGESEDIDGEIISVENENGDFVFEK